MKIIQQPKLSSELQLINISSDLNPQHVNYYHEGVRAGFPSPADDFRGSPLSLDEKYLSKPNSTFMIRVVGNSMYPTLLMNDILIVRSDETIKDGEIGIMSVNNADFTVKRFNKNKNSLIADNPEHKNIELDDEDTIICLGVVRHLIRDLQ